MECNQCGVCCVEISISSAIPGMPNGKKAGEKCMHLADNNLCSIFGQSDRPAVCSSFKPSADICGSNGEEATTRIRWFERATSPV